MKKSLLKVLFILALIPVLTFSGCVLKKDSDKTQLKLGLDASFPPMGFKDENNNITGFDIDVAQEVCNRLDMELVCVPIDWDTKETELNAGNIDCIWNGMSYSDERAASMNLSQPYMQNSMVLVVNEDSGYKSQADLKDKVVAVQNGSTAQEILNESDFVNTVKSTVELKDNPSAFVELENNTVDAVFVDVIVADYYITSQNKDFVVLKDGLAEEDYVIGFRKADEDLKKMIVDTLIKMKNDGKLAEISTKWFGKDITTIQ